MAQHVPTFGEIAGQEKHQQNADDLDRLEAEQVDLGVAGSGTGAEENQQRRKGEAGQQRHKGKAAEEAFVVQLRRQRHEEAAGQYALGEIHEQQIVAHRIAQADHEDQPDAAEHQDGGQEPLLAGASAEAPEQVGQQEAGEEEGGPAIERAAKHCRAAHDEQGLQGAQLLAGEQRDGFATAQARAKAGETALVRQFLRGDANACDGADIRQAAHNVIDFARDEVALGGLREHLGEGGQQIFARAQVIQIEKLLGREARIDLRQPLRFGLIHRVQAERQGRTRGHERQQFLNAPAEGERAASRAAPHIRTL